MIENDSMKKMLTNITEILKTLADHDGTAATNFNNLYAQVYAIIKILIEKEIVTKEELNLKVIEASKELGLPKEDIER